MRADALGLRQQRDNTHTTPEIGHERYDGDDAQNDMFLHVAPIQWVIGICRRLRDQNRLAISCELEVGIMQLRGIEHVRAENALLVDEGGRRILLCGHDMRLLFLYVGARC